MALRWWRRAVFYQIYPRSFADSNGDGIGDLDGVTAHLDYLSALGIDAIWLNPINPSPLDDWGYDVSDYCGIHPDLGDLAAFDRLLAQAHHRGIRVIVDLVPNHSSNRHPWFVESRASRNNPKRDWYIWVPGTPDRPPNNWLSTFGGIAWKYDSATASWYLHTFLEQQPDLNFRNPEMVEAMHDVIRFWLDRGADGFRIDVVANMIKDAELRDNPIRAEATPIFRGWAEASRTRSTARTGPRFTTSFADFGGSPTVTMSASWSARRGLAIRRGWPITCGRTNCSSRSTSAFYWRVTMRAASAPRSS